MRVAIVHDWLTGTRGGERVLSALLELFPEAEIFTLLHVPGSVDPAIEARPIHTSFIQKFPRAARRYRYYLPLFPAAVERFDLRGFELVISSSHSVAKGVRIPPGAAHLCYCHTPMRYVWDAYGDYFGPGRAPAWIRAAAPLVARRLRRWDRDTASRVERFVANSGHVRHRIRRCYDRDAAVVHPPVDVERFRPTTAEREDFYLIVTALVPYKRVDLAVEAFTRLRRPLVVVGSGPELARLRRAGAASPHVRFTGRLSDPEVADLMGRCRAFVMPQEEDFGIAAVEAQAAGAPVIAFGRGGALETVVGGSGAEGEGATGVFFPDQTPEALADAVLGFESLGFDADRLRENARRFTKDVFFEGIRTEVGALLATRGLPSSLLGTAPRS